MPQYIEDLRSHKQAEYTIKVDEDLYNIIQYINDEYPHAVISHASCQEVEVDGQAYITFIVRDLDKFDEMLSSIFRIPKRIHYQVWEGVRQYTIHWNPKDTERVDRLIKGIKDREEKIFQAKLKERGYVKETKSRVIKNNRRKK